MYAVTIYNGIEDTQGTLINSPFVDDLKCDFVINQVLGSISDMDLIINMANPAWGRIKPLTTFIKVENYRTGRVEFEGRILKPTQEMKSDGYPAIKYACESKLAYLNDSNQRYAVVQDTTIADFFAILINKHNEQVEEYKQFKVGNVTVTNNTDNVYRYIGYGKTFAEIKDNLIDRLGGYLVLREETDGTYIDYLASVGEIKQTPIQLRTNLKSMRRDIDPTQIITRVIPLGARLESEEGGTGAVSQPRLTIESVNDGKDYIDIPDLQEEFGIINGEIVYDDVNTPSILLLRGQQFIEEQKAARVSYDITPLNLSLTDTSFEPFELGNYHPIVNQLFGIDETLQIIEKKIDSKNPQNDTLTFGEKQLTLTQYQVQANKQSKKVEELENTVNSQSQRLAQVSEEYNNLNNSFQELKQAVDDQDYDAIEDAINNLNQAVNDLSDAVNAIPDYEPATQTEDGLMSSDDKTKLDLITVLNNVNLDDLKQKLDLITVTQQIDLDQLYQDVEDLKNG